MDTLSQNVFDPRSSVALVFAIASLAVTAQLISAFVFATYVHVVLSLFFLYPKFQASSYLMWFVSTWSESLKTDFLITRLIIMVSNRPQFSLSGNCCRFGTKLILNRLSRGCCKPTVHRHGGPYKPRLQVRVMGDAYRG